ncbi:MAG: type II toxin-antitoxin system HigB family toxin [Acidobacteria bacterium]|nr:type II toxin-antitoxin system HigB family toxin [Acidobacteriota bacterium]
MHVISRKHIVGFVAKHPNAGPSLDGWYRIARRATWLKLTDVQEQWPSAEAVGDCTIFNIGGNNYRLIAKVYYRDQVILIRFILTHAEYGRGGWHGDCNYKS